MVRLLRDPAHHLRQSLAHGEPLSQLLDLPLPGAAHQKLHPQGAGDQGLHPGHAAVFPQIIQILQYKHGMHPGDIRLHRLHHPLEGLPRRGQLVNQQGDLGLPRRGGTGIEHMDVAPSPLLPVDGPCLHSHVVGAGQRGGQGDDVGILPLLKLLQILAGSGTGGPGRFAATCHQIQQGLLVKALIVHDDLAAHMDGQRDLHKPVAGQEQRGRVSTAVADDLVCHK